MASRIVRFVTRASADLATYCCVDVMPPGSSCGAAGCATRGAQRALHCLELANLYQARANTLDFDFDIESEWYMLMVQPKLAVPFLHHPRTSPLHFLPQPQRS